MPIVTIEWLRGRTLPQKEEIAKEVTRSVSVVSSVDPEDIWVRFVDVDPSDWAIGGRLQRSPGGVKE